MPDDTLREEEQELDFEDDESSSPPQRSTLAIISFVLGIAAFMVCWIPVLGIVGFPLSGLGLILGISALIEISATKRSGAAFAISGLMVCAVAIWVPIQMLKGCGLWVDNVRDTNRMYAEALTSDNLNDNSVEDWRNDESNDLAADLAEATTNWLFKDVVENSTTTAAVSEPVMTPATEASTLSAKAVSPKKAPLPMVPVPTKPSSAGTIPPAILDDLQILITSVTTGIVSVKQINGQLMNSDRSYLRIGIRLDNRTKTRKIQYRGFGGTHVGYNEEVASLTDNFGNSYKGIKFPMLAVPEGSVQEESIYPNRPVSDVLVFEEPIDGIEYLELGLPLNCVGAVGKQRVRIPKDMIKRSP